MQIDLSELSKRTVGKKIFIRDLLKIYSDFAVSNILHAIILNYPILILRSNGENNRTNDMNLLFNDFLPKDYQHPGIAMSIEEKDYQKAKIEDCLVISPHGMVAQTPWNDIANTFERDLIRKALDILDDESQAIIIQQELEFILRKAKFIAGILKGKSQIFENDLKELVQKEFTETTISDYDLILLKHIAQRCFKSDITKIKIHSLENLKSLW